MPKIVTQVTFSVDGEVTTRRIELPTFTKKAVLDFLNHHELCQMDRVVQNDYSITVEIAQEKPWTWDRHVFVA